MYIYMYVCIYIYVCMYIIPHISIYCCFCWDPDPSLVKNQRAKSTTLRRTLFVYIIILQSGNEIDIDTESPWFPYRKWLMVDLRYCFSIFKCIVLYVQ
jgi:hypothetical protein